MQTIDRVQAPTWQNFWATYVAAQKPVIIEGLFDDQPLGQIRSRQQALEAFPEMTLEFKGEYVEHYLNTIQGLPPDPRIGEQLTYAQYCDHVDQHPETGGWMGQEKAPKELTDLYEVPVYCSNPDGTTDKKLVHHTFIGHPGKSASLHIDTDYKQVLVYEIYGRKKVYLVPAYHCLPLRTKAFLSRLDLSRLKEKDREDLIHHLGGWTATLEPGDCLFLPFSLYHHFEYLDHAMSINLRFGRNRYHQPFYKYMIPDWSLHALAAKMATESSVEGRCAELYQRILGILAGAGPSAQARYESIRDQLRALAVEVDAVHPDNRIFLAKHLFYQVPNVAEAYLSRFRLAFQRCYWHREAGGTLPEKRREAPGYIDQEHVSLWVSTIALNQIPAKFLTSQSQPLRNWLMADFDLEPGPEQQLEVYAQNDYLPGALQLLLDQVPLGPECRLRTAKKAAELGIESASLLLVMDHTRVTGAWRGSEYLTFLGSFRRADRLKATG